MGSAAAAHDAREIIASNLPTFLHLFDHPPSALPTRDDLLSAADSIMRELQTAGFKIERKP